MSNEAAISVTSHRVARAHGRSRFFFGMSVALLAIVLIAFAPTLYLRPLFDVSPMPPYLLVHGAILTIWYAWLVLQTSLVAAGRRDLHRRFGIAGALLTVVVLGGSMLAQLGKSSRLRELGVDMEARIGHDAGIFWVNVCSLLVFAAFVASAVLLRARPDAHKRLMLVASISIMSPAWGRIARWPVFGGGSFNEPAPLEGLFATGGVLLLVLVLVMYDLISRKRLHPATVAGCASVVLARIVAIVIALSAAGQALTQ